MVEIVKDYKNTLNLPKTDFSMKANLPQREPQILEKWAHINLYKKILEKNANNPKFVLHDGPPYANENIHLGHALNKVLKDIIVKFKNMAGFQCVFIPGWDCHGLPIELIVDRQLGKEKAHKTKMEIRQRCREHADRFVKVQKEQFIRLGVLGDWDHPYLTMNKEYEATIVKEFGKLVEKGMVYRGRKVVHWCASCQTALAEAEVEYQDRTSPSIYVTFTLTAESQKKLGLRKETSFIIWTTTPWTLPANLAIALGADATYAIVEYEKRNFIIAKQLISTIAKEFGWQKWKTIQEFEGKSLHDLRCSHPFIDRESRVIVGDHVSLDVGTGCVHTAPGHGEEDFLIGQKYGLEIYTPVDEAGRFTNDIKEWKGMGVFKANPLIIKKLAELGHLVSESKINHSYPHCWRCKNPIIFRGAEQWFISMEKSDLRQKALQFIDSTKWIPSWGRNRIHAMILQRPDWCISRQRVWGVPIISLYCKGCHQAVTTSELVAHVSKIFAQEGSDSWFSLPMQKLIPSGFQCPQCHETEFDLENDILDVWFESGVSFAAVVEKRKELSFPADLYLEGSDQHRGWFHSSLLASVATRGNPPYRAVLTHGFVVDGEGRKMSKSLGNVVDPLEFIKQHGGDVLRLWICSEDYRNDIRCSNEIITRVGEAYRKIRNTLRHCLANLYDFVPASEIIHPHQLAEEDRWILHRLQALIKETTDAYEEYEFHKIYHLVHNFCVNELSSLYFDMTKDRLYTSKTASPQRKAAQTTLYHLVKTLSQLLAPILSFTMEEVWEQIHQGESIHLSQFPKPNREFMDDRLDQEWRELLLVRAEVYKALEQARNEKKISSSLQASLHIVLPKKLNPLFIKRKDWLAIFFIVSQVTLSETPSSDSIKNAVIPDLFISVEPAPGQKCTRCWIFSKSVGTNKDHPLLCDKCVTAIQ